MCLCIDLRGHVPILGAPSARWLHLSDVCFLLISLWQISQIQTCVRVCFGPGFVSISPAFNSSSASQPAGPLGWPAQKNGRNGPPLRGAGGVSTICAALSSNSPTTCRLYSFGSGCTLLDRRLYSF